MKNRKVSTKYIIIVVFEEFHAKIVVRKTIRKKRKKKWITEDNQLSN